MSRLQRQLRSDVGELAGRIGERNIHHYDSLTAALQFVAHRLGSDAALQTDEAKGHEFANVSLELAGDAAREEIVVVGAHYDSAKGSPGANDNASGVAALLALADSFRRRRFGRTLRLVAFVNEERPFLRTRKMGSRVYARACRERGENVAAMLSLETIGFCSAAPGSQRLSFGGWLLPTAGDFLALVANRRSRPLLHQTRDAFRRTGNVAVRPLRLPENFPGAWSSDHWSFWREGYAAVMITDTAPLRYPHYHKPADTPDRIDYPWLELATGGIDAAVESLLG
jgi:Zn-dependent M28 family amino/carboxypeptidase